MGGTCWGIWAGLVAILMLNEHCSDAFRLDGRLWGGVASAFLGFALPISITTQQLSTSLYMHPSSMLAFAVEKGDVVYKSGKTPDQFKNKNKDDKSGTKKDIKFLRCLSNCKTECQKPSDGLANLDCNQDCQDQCCESYEQCSFKVRTRSSEL